MRGYPLIGLGILAVGIIALLHHSKKKHSRQVFNGIVIKPTAVFIWQSSSKHPRIDFHQD